MAPSPKHKKEEDEPLIVKELRVAAEAERGWRIAALGSFAALMLVVGLPLWWRTTGVRREALPEAHIDAFAVKPLPLPLKLHFFWADAATEKLSGAAREELRTMFLAPEMAFHERLSIRPLISTQKAPAKALHHLKDAHNFADLVKRLDAEDLDGTDLKLFFLPASFRAPNSVSVFFGDARNVYVTQGDQDLTIKILYAALSEVFLSRGQVQDIIRRHLKEERTPASERMSGGARVSGGGLAPSSSLDVYAVHPEPGACRGPVGWDLGGLARGPLAAIADKLRPLSDIGISTHTLYTVDWAKRPVFSGDLQAWTLREEDLPHLINPMEAYITSREPTRPVFNLLVYATPPEISPLLIVDKAGLPVEGNSFVIASWGGVSIVNGCPPALPHDVLLPMASQIRQLVGLAPGRMPKGVGASSGVLKGWELERLGLQGVVENAVGTAATLASLTQLLGQIRNIVIDEEVAGSVNEGVAQLALTHAALESGDLHSALAHSKKAVEASEAGFFHPSLLKLLYFPDDQKYAIYIPLFLPVGLPVLLSLSALLNYVKQAKKPKTD